MPPPPSAPHSTESERLGALPTSRLLALARKGNRAAVNALFERYFRWLRRKSRKRLPSWARGIVNTSDMVQDALTQTFVRLPSFESKGVGALRAYLLTAVDNRIRDRMREAGRRPVLISLDEVGQSADERPSPLDLVIADETWTRYRKGLENLSLRDRRLVVGRLELEYTYKQLAAIDGRKNEDAARMAVKRALKRLVERMPDG